ILETPKGNFSGRTLLIKADFSIEVPFTTYSSTSFWHTDSCNTIPSFVEIKVLSNQRLIASKRLGFKDYFVEYAPHGYSLKRDDLTIDILRDNRGQQTKSR